MKVNATANPVMTGIAAKFAQGSGYVGRRLFPIFNAGLQSASYYVFDEVNMMDWPTNIQRGPGGRYSRSLMKLSDDTFNCREYGHEEPLDDGERRKYASVFDADSAATRRAANIILANHELRVKAKAISSGVPTASPGTKWDAGGTPIADIDVGKASILKNTGMTANMLVMSWDVFKVLKEHATITPKIQYSVGGVVTEQVLAVVFGVDQIVVAKTIQNTANEGQTLSPAFIWGKDVVLAHVENGQDLMAPNFGRTFSWNEMVGPDGMLIESYRSDEIASDVFRARQYTDEKLVGKNCGYYLSAVLS